MIVIATAGWTIPRVSTGQFPATGTHLQRYAQVLGGAEINTSFYREHSADTYRHWAAQVPRSFRFAVKLPRLITHDQRLRNTRKALEVFLGNASGLGQKLGPLIVQLPPSLVFEPRVARNFFTLLRERHGGQVVCEPRHPSWFEERAEALLRRHRIARVAADPATVPAAALPGGWAGIVYYRLHGSPRKYWSVYGKEHLERWTAALAALPRRTPAWCVLDNTAGGCAASNALQMMAMLGQERSISAIRRRGVKSDHAAR